MKILVAEKLSEHRYKTPEGYLICVDSILARTGKQTYNRSEIFGDSENDGLIEVDRKAEEVFSPETMASFENKPICVEHPDVDVNSGNISEFAVGFVRDIHKGEYEGEPVMLGTLVITDAKTVEEIEEGKHTDLSCGYDCDIDDSENPQQRNIRGNHVALCEQGRAGIARIMDSVKDEESTYAEVTKNLEKEAKKDMSWLDAVVKDSKRITDFDDTPRNVRVVKEFIEKNGNKFSKSKDADAILEYIKKRTGIANADYGDVLHIIKEYTRAEITDSVKDAQQTFRVLAVVPGDYDDEPGFDIIFNVKANSENEAIIKAKKYAEKTPAYKFAWDFRIAKSNQRARIERNVDSVKDAKTEYVFNYHDTYHGTRDKMRVDANNLDEAIREFGKTMALGGFGTANIYVVSVSPNDGYMRAYGKLSEMLKQKWTRDSVKDFVNDGKRLPTNVKNEIQKFLNHKSTFIKNRNYDVSEFVREFERITKSWMEFPLKLTRESIKGWNKMGDGMMRKDYVFSIDGYDEEIIISLYAKPDTYETTEINTYFLDSVRKLDSKKLLSIVKAVRAVKSIKSNDAKETKLTFTPTNDVINIDMTNTLVGKLVSSGIDYHSAKKNAGKYSVVIIGDNSAVHKAKLIIENIGFFSKWS